MISLNPSFFKLFCRFITLKGVDGGGGKGNPSIGVATLSDNVLLSLEKFFVASFSTFSSLLLSLILFSTCEAPLSNNFHTFLCAIKLFSVESKLKRCACELVADSIDIERLGMIRILVCTGQIGRAHV